MKRVFSALSLMSFCLLLNSSAFAIPQTPNDKKKFSEEDVRERGRGEWNVSAMPDAGQYADATVPVKITKTDTFLGRGKYAGLLNVTGVTIQNGGEREVTSLRLGWAIVDSKARAVVLLRGDTDLIEQQIPARSRKLIEIPDIHFVRVAKSLRRNGELNGDFVLYVSVSEINFADGSTWRPIENVAFLKARSADIFDLHAPGFFFRPCELRCEACRTALTSR